MTAEPAALLRIPAHPFLLVNGEAVSLVAPPARRHLDVAEGALLLAHLWISRARWLAGLGERQRFAVDFEGVCGIRETDLGAGDDGVADALVLQNGGEGDVVGQNAAFGGGFLAVDEEDEGLVPVVADQLEGVALVGGLVAIAGEARFACSLVCVLWLERVLAW
jgi:hypothetical protein